MQLLFAYRYLVLSGISPVGSRSSVQYQHDASDIGHHSGGIQNWRGEKTGEHYSTEGERSFKTIDALWMDALAMKTFMLMVMYVTCEVLNRCYSMFAVANDEPRFLSLLMTTRIQIRRGRNAITGRNNTKLSCAAKLCCTRS